MYDLSNNYKYYKPTLLKWTDDSVVKSAIALAEDQNSVSSTHISQLTTAYK